MAFTGTAVVTSLGKNIIRITGLSLASSAAGTITDNGGGGDAELPTTFPGILVASTKVDIMQDAGALAPLAIVPVDGTITVTNQDTTNASGALIIDVENPHSLVR